MDVTDIICRSRIWLWKNLDQNYELLSQLHLFQILELPIMVGLSRKSMIYKALQIKPEEALNGTTALHMIALQQGASILRVHDVAAAKEAIELNQRINQFTKGKVH